MHPLILVLKASRWLGNDMEKVIEAWSGQPYRVDRPATSSIVLAERHVPALAREWLAAHLHPLSYHEGEPRTTNGTLWGLPNAISPSNPLYHAVGVFVDAPPPADVAAALAEGAQAIGGRLNLGLLGVSLCRSPREMGALYARDRLQRHQAGLPLDGHEELPTWNGLPPEEVDELDVFYAVKRPAEPVRKVSTGRAPPALGRTRTR